LTRLSGAAKGPRVTGALAPGGRAGEFALGYRPGAAPKEQPPPESLRHQGPREPGQSGKCPPSRRQRWTAEGAKLSGAATDGGDGRTAFVERWLSSP